MKKYIIIVLATVFATATVDAISQTKEKKPTGRILPTEKKDAEAKPQGKILPTEKKETETKPEGKILPKKDTEAKPEGKILPKEKEKTEEAKDASGVKEGKAEKVKEKDDREHHEHREGKEEAKDVHGKGKDKDHHGKGHAYGRDKGDMSGKEFGKLRSAEARSKAKADLDKMDKEIKENEKTVEDMNRKIDESEKKVAEEKSSKKISDQIYKEKIGKIDEAKQKAKSLYEQITKKRAIWTEMNDELKKAEAEAEQQ